MISYLEDWLKKRVGHAPVWVALVGEQMGRSYTMIAVDAVGIVLVTPASNNQGVAYPWSAISSVLPETHKS